MKKMRILAASLMVIGLAVVSLQANAQDKTKDAKEKATKVEKFSAGKALTDGDLGFLTMVTETKVDKTRGATQPKEVMVGKNKLTVGSKLTQEDVTAINKMASDYNKKHKDNVSKDESKSRGAGDCYYYCYYDAYGNYICYWYCY